MTGVAGQAYETGTAAANRAYETGAAAAGTAYETGREGVRAGRDVADRATISAQQAVEDAQRGYQVVSTREDGDKRRRVAGVVTDGCSGVTC